MKTYAVVLHGHIEVVADVVAESRERAAEIAWHTDEYRPGESVVYQQEMTCYDGAPEVSLVYELTMTTA